MEIDNFHPDRLTLDAAALQLAKRPEMPKRRKAPSDAVEEKPVSRKRRGFIRGPIDAAWTKAAIQLGGKAAALGYVLWYLRGLRKSDTFTVSSVTAGEWGIDRHAKRRALQRLETAGLIAVERPEWGSPTVTMLEVPR